MGNYIRKRSKSGWAYTKYYPHVGHPAVYYRIVGHGDNIEYICFTHSPKVDMGEKGEIWTIPMLDNVNVSERNKNKQDGLKIGVNRSYAYPKVFVGKRSALRNESSDFDPVDFDKRRIEKMFGILPREYVPVTGGRGKWKTKRNKKGQKK